MLIYFLCLAPNVESFHRSITQKISRSYFLGVTTDSVTKVKKKIFRPTGPKLSTKMRYDWSTIIRPNRSQFENLKILNCDRFGHNSVLVQPPHPIFPLSYFFTNFFPLLFCLHSLYFFSRR